MLLWPTGQLGKDSLGKYKGAKLLQQLELCQQWSGGRTTSGQNNDFSDIRRRKGLTEIHFIKDINSYLNLSILHCNMPALAEK